MRVGGHLSDHVGKLKGLFFPLAFHTNYSLFLYKTNPYVRKNPLQWHRFPVHGFDVLHCSQKGKAMCWEQQSTDPIVVLAV